MEKMVFPNIESTRSVLLSNWLDELENINNSILKLYSNDLDTMLEPSILDSIDNEINIKQNLVDLFEKEESLFLQQRMEAFRTCYTHFITTPQNTYSSSTNLDKEGEYFVSQIENSKYETSSTTQRSESVNTEPSKNIKLSIKKAQLDLLHTKGPFSNSPYWLMESLGCYTSKPLFVDNFCNDDNEESQSNNVSLLAEAEAFVRLYGNKDQKIVDLYQIAPRHLLIHISQVVTRAWFDPSYCHALFHINSPLPSFKN